MLHADHLRIATHKSQIHPDVRIQCSGENHLPRHPHVRPTTRFLTANSVAPITSVTGVTGGFEKPFFARQPIQRWLLATSFFEFACDTCDIDCADGIERLVPPYAFSRRTCDLGIIHPVNAAAQPPTPRHTPPPSPCARPWPRFPAPNPTCRKPFGPHLSPQKI
jgi:hypothetical protein